MATKSSTVRILPPCGGRETLGRRPQGLCYGGPDFDDQGGPELDAIYQVCLLLSSCSGANSKDQLVGKWKGKNEGSTVDSILEFTKDGKVKKEAIGVQSIADGTYRWIDNDNVEISLTFSKGPTITEKSKVNLDKDR